jgi:predicted aldo/keto reductase-like oxidoreductase
MSGNPGPPDPISRPEAGDGEPRIGRREFLQRSSALALGLTALGIPGAARAAAAEAPGRAAIKRYVTLGRTGLTIPDICGGGFPNAAMVRYCYDRGVTYFDTAQMFGTEIHLGKGLQGVRDKVVITTKYKIEPTDDRQKIMGQLEKSLRALKTDRVDIYLNHAVNEMARVQNPEWPEFVALAKKQGKIRFSGMSGHGGHLQECLNYVLDHDLVDVILAAYNFGTDPAFYERFTKDFDVIANQKGLPVVLAKAHAKGVGVLVMKTLRGAKLNDLSKYQKDGASYPRAAFRWVLSNPSVHALVISMKTRELAEEYIGCSGDRHFAQSDAEVLKRYLADQPNDYCRPGCGACESSCPHGVAIADVLRQRMYAESYGDLALARQGYAQLGAGASPCLSCAHESCARACPYGLAIPELTRATARRLHTT